MKTIRFSILIIFSVLWFVSCEDLTELNIDPTGVDPAEADPNLLLSTIMIENAEDIHFHGWFEAYSLAGVMQHLQRDSWQNPFNNFQWGDSWASERSRSSFNWDSKYGALRTTNHAYQRAVEENMEFHQGVALVLKSMIFGRLTDMWGPIPYTEALKGTEILHPSFDNQETVYRGIIEDLKRAADLLSKERTAYIRINPGQDVYYGGDPAMWHKLANSLALRYYMRLSEKLPAFAEAGVTEMLTKQLITDVSEDANMYFLGHGDESSWQANTVFDPERVRFNRLKPCTTLSYRLNELDDPRREVFFSPVEIPVQVSDQHAEDNVIVDGVRYLHPDYIEANNFKIFDPDTYHEDIAAGYTLFDTNSVYVGIPPAMSTSTPNWYNFNPSPAQGGTNPHVSYMAEHFRQAAGEHLKVRILTAAEVYFIKAEAALRGWGSDAEGNYNAGVRAALEAWGLGGSYESYITNEGVAFNGTLEQIMEQKWISNFTTAAEAWFDWRRTGYPELQAGPVASRPVLPLRFRYHSNEKNRNSEQYFKALENLEETGFSGEFGKDSPFSKMWLLQGTGKPW